MNAIFQPHLPASINVKVRSKRLRVAEEGDKAVLEIVETHPIPALRSFFFDIQLVDLAQLPGPFIG